MLNDFLKRVIDCSCSSIILILWTLVDFLLKSYNSCKIVVDIELESYLRKHTFSTGVFFEFSGVDYIKICALSVFMIIFCFFMLVLMLLRSDCAMLITQHLLQVFKAI